MVWFVTFIVVFVLAQTGVYPLNIKGSWLGDWSIYGIVLPLAIPVAVGLAFGIKKLIEVLTGKYE